MHTAISSNLCRWTGHDQIARAIQTLDDSQRQIEIQVE